MAERSDRILEPAAKFLALKDALGQGKTDEAFSEGVLGIKRTTYRSLIGGTHNGALEENTQRALRATLEPVIGDFWLWPEWIESDPAHINGKQRRDTAKSFKDKLVEVLRERAERGMAMGSISSPTTTAPSGWPLYLADCEDTKPPVSLTLGNVSLLLSSQRIAVGEDGYLSAIVRCHEAKWGGLAVAATVCTLTLFPMRRIQRSVNPPPLKDVALTNARGDKVVVERLGPMTVRIRAVAGPDKKVRPIGEVELPGALWAIVDARVGDVFECEMCVLLRDVSAESEPDDSNALINARGDPLDDTMMLKLEKRFEEKKRVFIETDANKSALLHKPRVTLAADSKKA